VVKAVRYGLTFLALPDEKTVALCDRVIEKQQKKGVDRSVNPSHSYFCADFRIAITCNASDEA
jgi:hypothetical protein